MAWLRWFVDPSRAPFTTYDEGLVVAVVLCLAACAIATPLGIHLACRQERRSRTRRAWDRIGTDRRRDASMVWKGSE